MIETLSRLQSRNLYKAKSIRSPEFKKQNEVLDAREHRFKAVNCTRRSGKSETEVRDHIEIARDFPGSKTIYMALTLDSCAEICWDVFKSLNDQHKLGMKFNETKKIIFYPNGSRTRLFGVDSSEREMKKMLGGKPRKVSIDEAGSMKIDMVKLCYQVIMPALADHRPNSWLTLLGTCENIPNTFFEAVTEGRETGVAWKVFKWTAYENPFMVRQWTEEIAELTKTNPKIVEASWFQTHYLNMWVTDENLLILDLKRATFAPWVPTKKAVYILGVDLGYNDDSSFQVVGYNQDSNKSMLIKSYKKPKLDLSDVVAEIRWLKLKYPFSHYIIDGANKQGVEEIRKRHQLPLEVADKQDKATFLRLLRDEIITGGLQLNEDRAEISDFTVEGNSLVWKDEEKEKEDPRCANHAVDGVLYAWRYVYNYLYKQPEVPPPRNTEAWQDLQAEQEAEIMRAEREEEELYG